MPKCLFEFRGISRRNGCTGEDGLRWMTATFPSPKQLQITAVVLAACVGSGGRGREVAAGPVSSGSGRSVCTCCDWGVETAGGMQTPHRQSCRNSTSTHLMVPVPQSHQRSCALCNPV